MGIPGFTRWLRKQYGSCFTAVTLEQPLRQQLTWARQPPLNSAAAAAAPGFEHVHWDLNARLYLVAERASTRQHLVKRWLGDLHHMHRWSEPRRSSTLALDGAPPAAKLWTQRLRRHTPSGSTMRRSPADRGKGKGRQISHELTLGTATMQQVSPISILVPLANPSGTQVEYTHPCTQVGQALGFFAVEVLQKPARCRTPLTPLIIVLPSTAFLATFDWITGLVSA